MKVAIALVVLVWAAGADAQQTGFFVPKSLCTEIKQPSANHVVCWDPTALVLKFWNGSAYVSIGAGLGSITVNAGAGTGLTIAGSPVSLGGTVTLGTTSDLLQYGALGLNTPAGSLGSVRALRNDGSYQYQLRRTTAPARIWGLAIDGGTGALAIDDVTASIRAMTVNPRAVTDATATVSIDRTETLSVDTTGGQNAALHVTSTGNNTSSGPTIAQPVAILGAATQTGSGDVVALFGRATQSGTGSYGAFGAYLLASTTTATGAAFGANYDVRNSGGAADAYVYGVSFPRIIGNDISYGSTNDGGAAMLTRTYDTGGWRTGISFWPSSITTNLIEAENFLVTVAGAVTMTQALLSGSTSGTLTVKAAAVAGTNTLTLPAGTTDFSATGGTSQVVKQTSAGGAFTVAQLAASDLSNGTTGSGAVVLQTSPTLTTPNLGAAAASSLVLSGVAFGSLGTPADGTLVFCSDCDPPTLIDQTCTSAGAQTGALAFRVNSVWKCIS